MPYSPQSRPTEYNVVTKEGHKVIEVVVPSSDYGRIKETVNRTGACAFRFVPRPDNHLDLREGSRLAFIITSSGQWNASSFGRTPEYSVTKVDHPADEQNTLIVRFETQDKNEARKKSKRKLREKGVPVISQTYQTEQGTLN
jgi:hypothetical protein